MIPSDRACDPPDSHLVEEVCSGTTDRFAILVRRYQGTVYRLALASLKDSEEAADAAQEVFLRAYNSLATFRRDRPFLPWLYGIAVNTLRTRGARRARRARVESSTPEIDQLFSDSRAKDPLEKVIDAERSLLVHGAVSRLPERLRAVVLLYYFEGLSVEETAKSLGIAKENVKSRLFRARRLLRRWLIGRLD